MFNRSFKWKAGTYQLFVQVNSEDDDKQIGLNGVEFTLSPEGVEQMHSVVNGYQFGRLNNPGNPATSALVRAHVLSANDALAKFRALPTPSNAESGDMPLQPASGM